MLSTPLRRLALAAAVTALVLPCLVAGPAGAAGRHGSRGHHHPELAFRGESTLPPGATFAGTVVGGLSSIAYDRRRDVYYALSDDQGAGFTPTSTPARFYTLDIDLSDGTLDAGDVTVLAVTTLRGPDGQPFPPLSLDPEGLTLTRDDRLIITSEGIATQGIAPFVREFDLSGRQVAELPVPDYFDPVGGTRGVRQNLGFEAAAVAPHGHALFVGAENALAQDGPAASTTTGSNARLLRYHLGKKKHHGPHQEWVYPTEPVVAPSPVFTVNGLVELLPLDNSHLLAMERSFSVGAGNTIRIFRVDLHGATNVARIDDLDKVKKLRTVRKTLLLDLDELGLTLDNIEGMTLGPRLPDGRRSLVLVSDNNFTAGQVSQFLMFALH
jgi:3-phytase/alkaline phosphatase D